MSTSLEKLVLILLFVLLPSQLALHFWPSWSFIYGVRVDYLSPTLFLTDILIIVLALQSKFLPRVPLGALVLIVVNIFFAYSPFVTLYKWIKVYEFFWLFKYLLFRKDTFLQVFPTALSWSAVWTTLLVWWQLSLQSSVGGVWYWLGERSFTVITPGIANIEFLGRLLLRPYATFPHSNALAGFLLVAGILLWKFGKKLLAGIVLLTLFVTFSKTAILSLLIVMIVGLAQKLNNKMMYLLLLVPLLIFPYLPSAVETIPQRVLLNQQAVKVISSNLVWGVGLGNFVAFVPTLRQPVHNIYLLLVSELGIVLCVYLLMKGVRSFWNTGRNMSWEYVLLLGVVGVGGLVDHYWLTLHQNILVVVTILALAKIGEYDIKNTL